MSEMPWVRFFPSDWLAGTRGMSAVETGVYITLIATMYERGGPIPEQHERLARLCGTTVSAFLRALENLVAEGKVLRSEEGLFNRKAAEELRIRAEKSDGASQKAKIRWGKKDNEIKPDPMPQHSRGNANQISEPEEKELTKVSSKKPVEKSPRQWLETVLSPARAEAVIEHRQRLRKPLTATAAKLLAGKFGQCADPEAAADMMVVNGWQGLEPAWVARHLEDNARSRQPSLADAFGAMARKEREHDLDLSTAGAIVLDLPSTRRN